MHVSRKIFYCRQTHGVNLFCLALVFELILCTLRLGKIRARHRQANMPHQFEEQLAQWNQTRQSVMYGVSALFFFLSNTAVIIRLVAQRRCFKRFFTDDWILLAAVVRRHPQDAVILLDHEKVC